MLCRSAAALSSWRCEGGVNATPSCCAALRAALALGFGTARRQAAARPPRSTGRDCCTRAADVHRARLCSVIHYSELLNNSAGRIDGICHRDTSHMAASSLRTSEVRAQHRAASRNWAWAALQHDSWKLGLVGSLTHSNGTDGAEHLLFALQGQW